MKSYTKSFVLDKTKKEKQIAGLFEYHIFCSIRINDSFCQFFLNLIRITKALRAKIIGV